jgi:hypothetical protein
MREHFKLLGFAVRDVVTGFAGVVTSISFDLYGCVQAVVTPFVDEKGVAGDGRWHDTKRLVATSDAPVMAVPTFVTVPGGQELPIYPSPAVP